MEHNNIKMNEVIYGKFSQSTDDDFSLVITREHAKPFATFLIVKKRQLVAELTFSKESLFDLGKILAKLYTDMKDEND